MDGPPAASCPSAWQAGFFWVVGATLQAKKKENKQTGGGKTWGTAVKPWLTLTNWLLNRRGNTHTNLCDHRQHAVSLKEKFSWQGDNLWYIPRCSISNAKLLSYYVFSVLGNSSKNMNIKVTGKDYLLVFYPTHLNVSRGSPHRFQSLRRAFVLRGIKGAWGCPNTWYPSLVPSLPESKWLKFLKPASVFPAFLLCSQQRWAVSIRPAHWCAISSETK